MLRVYQRFQPGVRAVFNVRSGAAIAKLECAASKMKLAASLPLWLNWRCAAWVAKTFYFCQPMRTLVINSPRRHLCTRQTRAFLDIGRSIASSLGSAHSIDGQRTLSSSTAENLNDGESLTRRVSRVSDFSIARRRSPCHCLFGSDKAHLRGSRVVLALVFRILRLQTSKKYQMIILLVLELKSHG